MKLRLSQKILVIALVPICFDIFVLILLCWLVCEVGQDSLPILPGAACGISIAAVLVAIAFNALFAVVFVRYFERTVSGRLKMLSQKLTHIGSEGAMAMPQKGALQGLADGEEKTPSSAESGKEKDEIAVLDQNLSALAASLHQSAEKERAVLNYASDVICSFDLGGTCLSMNAASKRLWGYEPDELIGKEIFSVIATSDRQRLLGHVHSVHVKTGPGEYELKVCRKDGTFADTLWSLYWSVENAWIVGVIHDITARKANERLQAEFTAMVSHDLRSPLSTIQMFLQGLDAGLWGELSEAARKNCTKARELIARLIGLTDDLLSFEKIEAGEFALNLEELDLSAVIEDSIHSVSGMAQEHEVQIVAESCNFPLVGDRTRLVQVLTNLLSNAVKYSPRGETVSVSATNDPDFVVVQVVDKGPGISDSDKGMIFDKFKQANSPDIKKGTGLGLAICRRYIEYHGGRIGVYDGASGGSIFWFKLPRKATSGGGEFEKQVVWKGIEE